jgi:hypothetical protein
VDRRTVIVGDVHGCLDELLALVRKCGAASVVLVGDLVAKGPDSAGVVRWAREHGARAVLGNHDEHVLHLAPGAGRGARRAAKPQHEKVAESLSRADWEWLGALPLWLALDDEAGAPLLVVHAGLVPGVPLEEQEREHLLTLRSITARGRPSKQIEGEAWASRWKGPPHVVFGHDAVRGLQQWPWATGLDTGCVYGHELTALVLPERELVSVPARRVYAKVPSKA